MTDTIYSTRPHAGFALRNWLIPFAVLLAVSAAGQYPDSLCDPPCTGTNTFCPDDELPAAPLFPEMDQCQCRPPYVPYLPAPGEVPSEFFCLDPCPWDHIRPAGTTGACTECTGDDSKPNYNQSRCLTRSCFPMGKYYPFDNCNHLKQVRTAPGFNGCGSPESDCLLKGGGDWAFEPACEDHDACYGRCGSSRSGCDDAFRRDARKTCQDRFGWLAPVTALACNAAAYIAYRGVKLCGRTAFGKAQRNLCHCCDAWQ